MTKQEVITAIEGSVSSIFTKEDVLKLLKTENSLVDEDVEADEDVKLYSLADLRRIFEGTKSIIAESLEDINIDCDWVELDSAGFSLSGNEIYLENIDLDEREIQRQLKAAVYEIEFSDNIKTLLSIA